MKNLKHPCIPQIYDIEEDEIGFYIVEQFIEGISLKNLCQKQNLQEKSIITYAIQICELIHYLHSREDPILYLDLKPDNIIVYEQRLYLVDFGCSRKKATPQKSNFGTPWFAAPEQYLLPFADERADIYGIGMLLYFMVFGQEYVIEKGKNIDVSLNCSKNLKRIINRCIKMSPYQRFSSVSELHKKLLGIQNKQKKKSDHIITIAFAGAFHRIGVTHVALQFTGFLNERNFHSVYMECNESHALSAIVKRNIVSYDDVRGYRVYNIPCEIYGEKREYRIASKCQYVIIDYGVLTSENLANIKDADYSIVIMGAKDWELDAAEECLELCGDSGANCYLFNFTSVQDFRMIQRNMLGKKCYRIPFEPQLLKNDGMFGNKKKSVIKTFFSELLQDIMEETGGKKNNTL